jgi:UTP-glucose-1-phosphate uridylyltransferase
LPRKIFEIIENLPLDEKTGEYLLPDALKVLMKTEEIIPYVTDAKVYDT